MRSIFLTRGEPCRAQLRWHVALAAVVIIACGAVAPASASAGGVRDQDEVLLVNVRPVGCCCDPATLADGVQIESYESADESGHRQWRTSNLASVVAADPSVSTVIFVHGNRLTNWDAKCEGVAAYRRVARHVADDAPIRFVIFSWPAAQISGPLKDVRVKAARTRPAGCQLAWFIDQLPAETPLTLVGFSFGARIVTGSLNILGGGSGGPAELQHPSRHPVNAVLLAAALNSDWLCPGHCHGRAMSVVKEMVLVDNCEDRAMKYYHFSTTNGRPQALGLCGPTCIDPAGAAKIVELNVGRYVGSEHNLFCYLSAPGVTSEIAEFAQTASGPVVAAN
jgi:hypothetical protein